MAKKPTKRQLMIAELHEFGVTRNDYGLIDKQPLVVLGGMLERVRSKEAARAAGAAPCPDHPDEFEGDCPWCLGIWAPLKKENDR